MIPAVLVALSVLYFTGYIRPDYHELIGVLFAVAAVVSLIQRVRALRQDTRRGR